MAHDDFTTPYFAKAREGIKKTNPETGAKEELPVHQIVDDVVKSVTGGKITILTADTGSGKTLLASTMLADASDHQVVVLVPRRFLAENASDAVSKISGTTDGKEVGYAIGKKAGDGPNCDPKKPKLLFCTYGYALSSGLLHTAKTIVFDEVHEAGLETSLARALVRKRLENDKDLRVMEMSATINAEQQAEYWKGIGREVAKPFHAEGNAYECKKKQIEDAGVVEIAEQSIQRGRKGIAIFLEGKNEVEAAALELKGRFGNKVDISTIYGEKDKKQRAEAISPPSIMTDDEGEPILGRDNKPLRKPKIIIGTNVMESGVNIDWLDTGISNGKTKIPFHRQTGATALITEELPQWRITQQQGRVHRFRPGEFFLCSKVLMKDRPEQNTPEITRVSHTGLVLKAAGYRVNPLDLEFDVGIDKEKEKDKYRKAKTELKGKLQQAHKELSRLGLVDEDWHLTEKGRYVHRLPLGAATGSMLAAANDNKLFDPAIFNDAIELAAIIESQGLRADFNVPHKYYKHTGTLGPEVVKSDSLESFHTFKELGYAATEEDCEACNVSWKRYKDVKSYIKDIREHHDIAMEENGAPKNPGRAATDKELQQVMLHGSVNKLFQVVEKKYDSLSNATDHNKYRADRGSVLAPPKEQHPRQGRDKVRQNKHSRHFNAGQPFAIADLRELAPKKEKVEHEGQKKKKKKKEKGAPKAPEIDVMAQNITPVSTAAFLEFATNAPGVLTDVELIKKDGRPFIAAKYFGETPMEFTADKVPDVILEQLLEREQHAEVQVWRERNPNPREDGPQGHGNKRSREPLPDAKARESLSQAELRDIKRRERRDAKKGRRGAKEDAHNFLRDYDRDDERRGGRE